jgi:hypothetical protein
MQYKTAKEVLATLMFWEENCPERLDLPLYVFNSETHELHTLDSIDDLSDRVDFNMSEKPIEEV